MAYQLLHAPGAGLLGWGGLRGRGGYRGRLVGAMSKKRTWIIRMKCTVTKEVITDKCTREEAEQDPWDHAEDEREIDQEDWEIKSLEPND